MKKVLVVEDEAVLREGYEIILSHQGYAVSTAENGEKALEKVCSNTYDVVLLDIFMPILDGKGFLRKSKIKEKYPHTKVIALSNFSDDKNINEVLDRGADLYVLKSSITATQLINIIEEVH